MKSLAAEQIKVARILLNLGHSYLHSTSLENSEDEEEEGEENEEQEEAEEEEEGEKYDGEYNNGCDEKMEIETDQQFNVQKNNVEEFTKERVKFNLNKQYNINEELEKQFCRDIPDKTNRELNLIFDKMYNVNTTQGFEKQTKQEFIGNIPNIFNKVVIDMLVNNLTIENYREVHKDLQNKLHEYNRNILCEIERIKQHIFTGDKEIKLDLKMLIQLKNLQELNEKILNKFNEKEIPKKSIERRWCIEMEVNSEFQQEQDKKLKEIHVEDISFDFGIDVHINKKCLQELYNKEQNRNQQKCNNEVIKYNINAQRNFENKVKRKENMNNDFYQESIDKIQLIFNKELQDDSISQQELNTKIKNPHIGINRKVLDKIYKEKKEVRHIFNKGMQFDKYEVHHKFDKEDKNKLKVEFNIDEDIHFKCNGKIADNLYKKKPIIILHDEQSLCDIKDKQMLCNIIQKKFSEKSQMLVNNLEFIFDGESLIELDKIKQAVKKYKTEFDNNSSKSKIQQDTEQVTKNKLNIKPPKEVHVDLQLEQNVDNDLQKTFHKDIEITCDSDIQFGSQLEIHKLVHEQIADTFNMEIQQEINKVLHDIVKRKENVNYGIQFSYIQGKEEEAVKHISKNIEELQREIEELYQDQYDELEGEIIKQINKIYSSHPKFLENLIFLFNQNTIPFNKRVEKLYNLYFSTIGNQYKQFNPEMLSEFEKNLRQRFNDKLSHQFNRNEFKDMNLILQKELKNEIQEVKQFDNKIKSDINKDIVKRKDTHFKFFNEIKDVKKEVEVDLNKEIQIDFDKQVQLFETKVQVYYGEHEQTQQINKCSDISIVFNNKNMDRKTQQVVIKKALVNFNEEILKDIYDTEQNIDQNRKISDKGIIELEFNEKNQKIITPKIEYYDNIKFDSDCYKKVKEKPKNKITEDIKLEFSNGSESQIINRIDEIFLEKMNKLHLEANKKKEVDNEMQIKVEEEIKEINDKIHLKFTLYNTLKIKENHIVLDMDIFKRKLVEMFKEVKEFDSEIKENFKPNLVNDKNFEKLVEESSNIDDEIEDKIQEEFGKDIEENFFNIDKMEIEVQNEDETKIEKKSDIETEEEFEIKKGDKLQIDIEELSDVEIEDFYDKIQDFPRKIKENEHEGFEIEFNDQNEDDIEMNEVDEELEDINEVIELLEIESTSSEDTFIFVDEESSPIKEYNYGKEEFSSTEKLNSVEKFSSTEEFSSTDDNFNSTLEKENFKTEIQQKSNTNFHEQFNNVQMNKSDKQETIDVKVQQEKKIDDLLIHNIEMKNIQDLDEIPLELKIQQEQLEENLHTQFKQFQKEFYKNLKLEYDKEQLLKVNKSFNPEFLHIFDEQKQYFYELKDEFHEIKDEYKDFVQQKIFAELQKELDENLLLKINELPEDIDTKLNLKFDEDIHKEFVKLQRDCSELEPEFKYNVPLEFEEEELEQKPLNIFEKLHFVHKHKLCDFVDSKQWPENCLYPSSLLDSLFEKPFEIRPNVLIITLYSIDVGYSIQLCMNENESPIEIFFNYAEDSILEYVENEQLPPCLLDLLDRAEPKLFYYGCVIAEIHNKKDGILNDLYRILLRPSNMSIQSDLNQILAENSNIDWSYKKRLKLESILLLISQPEICMDSSPIAGLTINLQHQMLSCRKVNLNPLKRKYTPSKLKPLELNLTDNLNKLHTSDLSNEVHGTLSKLIDSNDIHHITRKFDFRIKSFKFISLFVLVIKETLEYSMFMRINPIVGFVMMIRFKINLKKNKLRTYINLIQEILKQKMRCEILIVQRYKSDDKLPSRSITCIPKLISDSIFEPNHTDINKLINNLLENKLEYLCDRIEFELKINTLDLSINLSDETQNNNTKETSRVIKVNHNMKKNNLLRTSGSDNILSTPKTNLEMSSKNIKENKILDVKLENKLFPDTFKFTAAKPIVVSKPLKSPTKPVNIFLDHGLTLVDSLDKKEKENTITTLSTPITNAEIMPFESSNLMTQTQSILNIKSPVSSLETTPLMSNPNNILSNHTDELPLISKSLLINETSSITNHTDNIPLISNSLFVTETSSVTNPITVTSPISSPVSKMSSVLCHKEAALNTDCKLVFSNLITPTDKDKLRKVKDGNTGRLKLKYLNYLSKKIDSAMNVLENSNQPVLCNDLKTASGTLNTSSFHSQCAETISVIKHVHDNGICLKGSKFVVNKAIPQITQNTTSVDQISTTDLQLDRRKKTQTLDDVLNTVVVNPSTFQVMLPNIVPLKPLSLSQCNSHNQVDTEPKIISSNDSFKNHQLLKCMKTYFVNKMSSKNNSINDDVYQEINNSTSSNIDGYTRKRKRTTS